MRKQLCACGCGVRVTPIIESQHMSALAPATLASLVLDQNRGVVRRKKSKTVGFYTPFRWRLGMGNTTETNNMDLDDNIPVSVNSSSQQLAKGKTAEIDDMDLDNDNNPVSLNSSDHESMMILMKPMVSLSYIVLDRLHPVLNTVSPFNLSLISAKFIKIII